MFLSLQTQPKHLVEEGTEQIPPHVLTQVPTPW